MTTGADLAAAFHRDVVGPLLADSFPAVSYAAARLGSGSDVLGYDDSMSRDHDWGCRLTLLVDESAAGVVSDIRQLLTDRLPPQYAGYPVRFPVSWDRTDTHKVEVATVYDFAESRLGVRPYLVGESAGSLNGGSGVYQRPGRLKGHSGRSADWLDRPSGVLNGRFTPSSVLDQSSTALDHRPSDPSDPLDALDWLAVSGQAVLEVIGGPVFADGTRELGPLRGALRWYPPDVDRFTLASLWTLIADRLQMVGRTAVRGQEIQSRLLTAQIADRIIHLAFLVHRQWMPYAKWREARLRTLPGADRLCGLIDAALAAKDWRDREAAVADAAELLLAVQRERGMPAPERAVANFWDRPFRTIDKSVVRLLLDDVTDERLRRLPCSGGVDLWIDSDEILSHPSLRGAGSAAAYAAWLALIESGA